MRGCEARCVRMHTTTAVYLYMGADVWVAPILCDSCLAVPCSIMCMAYTRFGGGPHGGPQFTR